MLQRLRLRPSRTFPHDGDHKRRPTHPSNPRHATQARLTTPAMYPPSRPSVLASVIVVGLSAAASAKGGRRGGTLRAALDGDPPTMDPPRSGSLVDRHVYQSLYDKLVETDQNLKIVPMLATSWTISPDGKTV